MNPADCRQTNAAERTTRPDCRAGERGGHIVRMFGVAVVLAVGNAGLWCCGSDGPGAEPSRDTRQPSRDAQDMLTRFLEELVRIAPGHAPFPESIVVRGRTLRPEQSFQIARYETTQELYELIMGTNPSRWRGPRNAVESMTAEQARQFCRRLTDRLRQAGLLDSRRQVRLPTAEEWEYACRAGSTNTYGLGRSGSSVAGHLNEYAWYEANAAGNDPAVGVLRPNAWGLYDMHGYVREFVEISAAESGGTAESGAPGNVAAMGGSWRDPEEELACDRQWILPPGARGDHLGFRCVVSKTASGRR